MNLLLNEDKKQLDSHLPNNCIILPQFDHYSNSEVRSTSRSRSHLTRDSSAGQIDYSTRRSATTCGVAESTPYQQRTPSTANTDRSSPSGPTTSNGLSWEDVSPFGVNERTLALIIRDAWEVAVTSYVRKDEMANPTDILINFHQSREGLQWAFDLLRNVVPMPDASWHTAVFSNYDEDCDGVIDFTAFVDIVTQYHDHHARRNIRRYSQKNNKHHQPYVDCTTPNKDPLKLSAPCSHEEEDSETLSNLDDNNRSSVPNNEPITLASHILFPVHNGPCEVFRDYEFGSNAGRGSFGKVQVVVHRLTGQRRACKTVVVACPEQWELIRQEIELMKCLNHPNILRLHEIYHDGYTIYLIIELCEGGQLFDRIVEHYEKKRKPITEAQVGNWMTQILSATAYCHEKEIIHRDIKPENILFVEKSEASPLKVIDFGLSSTRQRIRDTQREIMEKKSGVSGLVARMMPRIGGKPLIPYHVKRIRMQRAGTPHYMAPEMIRGYYDEQCDMFAVGVIMHQLLVGIHPFYTPGIDDENSVRERILNEVPTFNGPEWASISPNAKDLCRDFLRKHPERRITAKEALQHPWFEQLKRASVNQVSSFVSVSVFEGLKAWQNQHKLKQAIVQLLAKELSEMEIKDLRAKFMALDKAKDGSITLDELRIAMKQSGHRVLESDLKAIMENVGRDENAERIGYNEFLSALLCKRMSFQEAQLREIFNKLDTKKEGRVSVQSLSQALKGSKRYGCLTPQETSALFATVDTNGDGYLDFYEFLEFMT